MHPRRKSILNSPRDHLVHVMPDLTINGCYNLALTITGELQNRYAHTFLTETDLATVNPDVLWVIQASGADVCVVDKITPEVLEDSPYTSAILYNVQGHNGIGEVMPSLYYSYGRYNPGVKSTAVVVCSEYARTNGRTGPLQCMLPKSVEIIPPMVATRSLRRLKAPDHPFTVGLITSGAYDKYPCDLAMQLMSRLPLDVRLLFSSIPTYRNPGMTMAIQDRVERGNNKAIMMCPVRPLVALHYMVLCDVIICASTGTHFEPYGRTCVEAMALGKPVLCENRGVYPTLLEHGVNSLLFNNVDDTLDYIDKIRKNPSMGDKLGSNAQLWASWQDVTVHIGKLKRTLRMIGG
jgi:hypothetical protein